MNEEWNRPLAEKIAVLENIKNVSTLRTLFVDELNYDYADHVAKIDYPESVKRNVYSAKIISEKGDFKIIFCTIQELLKGTEFPVVESISRYYPSSNLIVFTNKDNDEFHFVNTRYVRKKEEKRVRGFRRITVGKTDRLRTAAERLSKIFASEGISPPALMAKCEEAFDVEAVTEAFYKEFVRKYEDFREVVQKRQKLSKDTADSLTQEIFNRLIFLYFIQKKGWLDGKYKFLYDKFKEFNTSKREYYKSFLIPLFKKLSIKDFSHSDFKNIPFLNGGLFGFQKKEEKVSIPNEAFRPVFEDLLERFNFTIREDTEDEEEVAIDPEMLGRIFENLILTLEAEKYKDIPDVRRKLGSYYTPRFVVSFMVKESLLNYLTSEFPDIARGKMKSLVFNQEIKNIGNIKLQNIKDRLLELKIVDPGIGSGAFAVDILNKVVKLIEKIDSIINKPDSRYNNRYKLREYLIENTIYGVDIQKRAVHLAHLRLWLSLIVDIEIEDIKNIPPLINLDFKVLEGDSLISKIFGYPFDMRRVRGVDQKVFPLIEQFTKLKERHAEAFRTSEKEKFKGKIEKKKIEIALWHLNRIKKEKANELLGIEQQLSLFKKAVQPSLFEKTQQERERLKEEVNKIEKEIEKIEKGKEIEAFNWYLDFFEVMGVKDGFDIVIGNPPYGIKEKESVRDEFGLGSKDSYGIFTAMALNILKPNGTLCFIMSDTWQTIRTHYKLREKLLNETETQYLISVPAKTFKATVNPGIYMFRKSDSTRRLQSANNFILAADFHNLGIKSGDLEAGFDILIGEDAFDETKDGYTIISDREMAIYAYRQKLIKRFSNLSFFIASPKLFKLMDDTTNVEMFKSPPIIKVDFNDKEIEFIKLGDIAEVVVGLQTGDTSYYIRQLPGIKETKYKKVDLKLVIKEDELEKIRGDEKLRMDVIENGICTNPAHKTHKHRYFGGRYFVPYDKGGASNIEEGWLPSYYVPTSYFIDWSEEAVHRLKKNPSARFQNAEFYFREGFSFSHTGQYSPTFRIGTGGPFDVAGSSLFLHQSENIKATIGMLGSNVCKYFLKTFINHTVNMSEDPVKQIPVVFHIENRIMRRMETMVNRVIQKQKQNPKYDYMTNEQIEIDRLVYEMYNLNEDDIKEVENWYHRRYPKLAKVIEEKIKRKNNG